MAARRKRRAMALCLALGVSACAADRAVPDDPTLRDDESAGDDDDSPPVTVPAHDAAVAGGGGSGGAGGGGGVMPDAAVSVADTAAQAGDSAVAGVGDTGVAGDAPPAIQGQNCGPAKVCDDFDDGDTAGWSLRPSGGKLAIDGTHAYSGGKAVMLTIPPNQRGGFLARKGAPLFPLPNNTAWGRMMIYYESIPGGHFDSVRGTGSGGGQYNIGGQGGRHMLNYFDGPNDCWAFASKQIATKKWMCWEWKMDGAGNELVMYVDGAAMVSAIKTGQGCTNGQKPTWKAPRFDTFSVGEFNAQTSGSMTRLWMDDVAMGHERVGCPPASATAR